MKHYCVESSSVDVGFTFSFPMIQEGLKKGILITWTKSFACPDGVGQDAGRLLEEAITRRGVRKERGKGDCYTLLFISGLECSVNHVVIVTTR